MNALLLAGGLGTRLRPLTENLPKPMAPVANRPWLEHLVIRLKQQGIRSIVVAVKHYPELIRSYFGTGDQWGVTMEYAVEHELLGTAGAIKNAEPYLEETFVVVNADIVHYTELAPLIQFHRRHEGAVTIALTEVDDPSHYGVVEQDEQGRILRFVEKPAPEEAPSRLVNAGIYIIDKKALQSIPEQREVSIERETFPMWIEQGAGVYGKRIDGYWMDMGTKERYRQIHWDLLNRSCPLPLPGKASGKGIWVGKQCDIHPGVLLIPPVLIGDRVRIGERSIIGPFSVIGSDSVIEGHVRCAETILWDRCTVRSGTVVNRCIAGCDVEMGPQQTMHEAVMIRTEAMQA